MRTIYSLLVLLLCLPAFGASKYIRAGAIAGSNAGTSWTNAYTNFVSVTWVRGDTYYLAGGAYTEDVELACSESGPTLVTLKKANVSDNGSDSGWDLSYATNQAVVTGAFTIYNSYITIDGVTGTGRSGYGIKFKIVSADGGNAMMNLADGKGFLSLSHLEMEGPGWGYVNGVSAFKHNTTSGTTKGLHLSDIWAYQWTQNGFVFVNVVGTSFSDYGLLYERVIIDDCGYNTTGAHGQAIQGGSGAAGSLQSFWTVKDSIFRNCQGTADIAFLGYSTNSDVHIYNNVFMNTNHSVAGDGVWTNYTALMDASSPGVIYVSSTTASSTRVRVMNNTFHKIARNTVYFADTVTNDNAVINNLFIDGRFNLVHQGVVGATNDYHLCEPVISSGIYGVPYGEDGQQTESVSPVASLDDGNFQLVDGANAIGNAVDLSAYFTTDITGATRSAPWDIGAYEYDGSVPVVPTPGNATAVTATITNLRVE